MGMRTEALYRLIVGTLWFLVATPLFVFVWFPVAVVLMVIDVLLQAITGTESIMPMNLHAQAYGWYTENLQWTLYGEGKFNPLPYV